MALLLYFTCEQNSIKITKRIERNDKKSTKQTYTTHNVKSNVIECVSKFLLHLMTMHFSQGRLNRLDLKGVEMIQPTITKQHFTIIKLSKQKKMSYILQINFIIIS